MSAPEADSESTTLDVSATEPDDEDSEFASMDLLAARIVSGKLSGGPIEDAVDLAAIERAVREILIAIGEDPERDGLRRTPSRVARAYAELFAGLRVDPAQVLTTGFEEDHDEMVLVRDMEITSMCVPSKQLVNTVGGARPARDVSYGDQLWTLVDGEAKRTTVVDVTSRKVRDLVEVVTEKGSVRVTPDHPFATPEGWVEAKDLAGRYVEWTPPRRLCRTRPEPVLGYEFGYVLGATCSDGTVADRYVSLVVNDRDFAKKFASALEWGFGLSPRIEEVSRPSGYTGQATPGFRVRVVSSYLADLVRQYVGGDAHHMRQRFPEVVLNDLPTFHGFLDGYVDGDGYRKEPYGNVVVSANMPFLRNLANVMGVKFTPRTSGWSALYIADSWFRKHGFAQKSHRTTLIESEWVRVEAVRDVSAAGAKPYTVYSFKCEPYPTFLIGGHLSHNCEHHLLPFHGVAHVGYIPGEDGRITGLSKLARLVEAYARRPQVQERLTSQVADMMMQRLEPRGCIVVVDCEHMCMSLRGIRKPGARTLTSAVRGIFQRDAKSRSEAMSLILHR